MKKTLVLLGSMCLSTHFAQVLSTSRYATGRSTSVYLLDTLGFFLQDHHSSIHQSLIDRSSSSDCHSWQQSVVHDDVMYAAG
jgi:hypothetical protein